MPKLENVMMEDRYSPEYPKESRKEPEARYEYYRRCQVFRRNGEQCKAPAEKGAHICYAHAAQRARAVRRERERRAVLAEAVAELRKRGNPECEMADLFMDFKGIQVTLAMTARAVINGRIDCKTAGQMLVHLQTSSKLLWQIHRKGRKNLPLIHTDDTDLKENPKSLTTKDTKEHKGLLQICADDRRSHSISEERPETLPLINTDDTDQKKLPKSTECHNHTLGARIFRLEVTAFGDLCRAHGPPESKAA